MSRIKEIIKRVLESIKQEKTDSSNNKKNKTYKFFLIVFVVMVLFSVYNLYSIQRDRIGNQKSISEAQSIFSITELENETISESIEEDPGDENIDATVESIEYSEDLIQQPIPEILNLKDRNEDVVGWITISNTIIDYPIVQADDNEFYLRRDWLKNSSIPGSIFLDYRNDDLGYTKPGAHSIIYGHHIRDGSMFQNLMKYKDHSFYEENRIIEITDLYETHKFEIFAAYITSTDFYFIETRFPSRKHFTNLAGEFIDRSMHATDIEITGDDHILTLMTCTYEYDDARFVVHARRID